MRKVASLVAVLAFAANALAGTVSYSTSALDVSADPGLQVNQGTDIPIDIR